MEGAERQKMVCPACNARYDGAQFCAKDGTSLVRDPEAGKRDLVGEVLADRYRIVRLIGEGGMGQVYEAQHVNINKRFAIKLLRPEIVSNVEAVARFRQEAWSASSIGHENIIEIDDFATLPSGSVYLAMEFLEGEALAERMRAEPPVELGDALALFAQVGRGLAAAHDKGIVHRDMKPENIFLAQRHGRLVVKILDFGIAKVSGTEGSSSLTRTGAIFGTPHYMSPEQAMGNSLDFRSDIYSVGVIMYEVFTGRVPFEAESFMGILTKHITSVPTRPTEMAPERNIPDAIEALIMRAMAKEPGERFASMHELVAEVEMLLQEIAPEKLLPAGPGTSQRSAVLAAVARDPTGPQRLQKSPTSVRGAARAPTSARAAAVQKSATPAFGAKVVSSPGAAPLGARASAVEDVVALELDRAPPAVEPEPAPKRGGLGLWIAIAGFLAAGAASAAFVLMRKPQVVAPIATVNPPVQPKIEVSPLPPQKLSPQPQPPPAADTVTVIVDSTPPGARILHEGSDLGDTPEEIKVPASGTLRVVLHREGFTDESVVIDPAKGRKQLFKLHKKEVASAPVKLPTPPPAPTPDPPARRPPVVTRPPSVDPPPVYQPPPPTYPPPPSRYPPRPTRPHQPVDPYERLDDKPRPQSQPQPRKSDVLNPY